MWTYKQSYASTFGRRRGSAGAIVSTMLVVVVSCFVVVVTVRAAQAQTYTVLHTFTGGPDGADPEAGLTADRGGNLYGTTKQGGLYGYGSVFKLTYRNSAWIFSPLYSFKGGADGAWPTARVVFGPDGSLYGTTSGSVNVNGTCGNNGCGTVFRLRPLAGICTGVVCPWTPTVLYRFTGGADGALPGAGDLVFDGQGNIYGSTRRGGTSAGGTVYKLMQNNGGWTKSVLYSFASYRTGDDPNGGVVFDSSGNLYGTTFEGGKQLGWMGQGVVFKLTPSSQGWIQTVLHTFTGSLADGASSFAGLTMDSSGNFYGTTVAGGSGHCFTPGPWGSSVQGCGTVFRGPQHLVAFSFPASQEFAPAAGGPRAPLSLDGAGNIYGTTWANGPYRKGTVFKLTSGQYSYRSLHDFTGGTDGALPASNVLVDNNGNLYGTASAGGSSQTCQGGCGVIWKITP